MAFYKKIRDFCAVFYIFMRDGFSGLQIQMYKPDILVTMSFDAYCSIADYARGEEISEIGRRLMSDALDKYERE